MKKLISVFIAIFILAAFLPRVRAADIFGAPEVTFVKETASANDKVFSFTANCGDAAGYERQRRSVYNSLVKQYGSDELARAALTAAGQETLAYPAVLYAEVETGGYTVLLGTWPADTVRFEVSLQKDVLPALADTGLYTHKAFTFRLHFTLGIAYDVSPMIASPETATREFSCPATAHLVYNVPQDAVNPNLSFPFLPYGDFTLAYPTRTGYTFAGWTDGKTGGYVSTVSANTLDRTFTAVWTPRTYKINYVLATRAGYSFVQVDNRGNPKTRVFGEETAVYDVTPPYGYLFMGWYETADFSGKPVTSVPADRAADTVLYAKWSTAEENEAALIKEKGYGDADGDGRISAADARIALRAAVRLETLTPAVLERVNVTGSGNVTSADAREILRISVGLEKVADVLKYYGIL